MSSTMKAFAVMVLWTLALIGIFNWIGFNDHFRELLWALGGAIFLLVILIGNVWIFFAVAKEEPFQWFKNSDEQ